MRSVDQGVYNMHVGEVRNLLAKRYPNFWLLPFNEQVLLCLGVLANDFRVIENTNNNDGEWIATILRSTGLDHDEYDWCAATIQFAMDVVDVHNRLQNYGPGEYFSARVKGFYDWAKKTGRLKLSPARADLCLWLNPDGTGHIGIVAEVRGNMIRAYEGNTTIPGTRRQGCAETMRDKKVWKFYIALTV